MDVDTGAYVYYRISDAQLMKVVGAGLAWAVVHRPKTPLKMRGFAV